MRTTKVCASIAIALVTADVSQVASKTTSNLRGRSIAEETDRSFRFRLDAVVPSQESYASSNLRNLDRSANDSSGEAGEGVHIEEDVSKNDKYCVKKETCTNYDGNGASNCCKGYTCNLQGFEWVCKKQKMSGPDEGVSTQ